MGDPTFDEGRYLYCVVETEDDAELSENGIDGEPISILVRDGLGAVVQPYD